MAITFPDGFVWGAASAAHQVEGGNWNNDWWMWEHDPASPCVEPSGDACDHFWRYPSDIQLLADLGLGAYRFSLEWSRIEPEPGEFSTAALDHYQRMIDACHERGVQAVVTFHHFSTPRWASAGPSWEDPALAEHFARFCEKAVARLGPSIDMGCTINEPNVVSLLGYFLGRFPPGRTDADAYRRAQDTLLRAHRLGYEAIKAGPGDFPLGLTLSMAEFQALPGGERNMQSAQRMMEDEFLEAARGDDYLGVQTYTRLRFGPDGMPMGPEEGVRTTLMGYEFWPEALAATIRHARDVYGGPLYVTENGIAARDDAERVEYVRGALEGVRACLDEGIDVRGYFYWSLTDNFEWAEGYGPTFGLIGIDWATQERTVRESAKWLGQVARANGF